MKASDKVGWACVVLIIFGFGVMAGILLGRQESYDEGYQFGLYDGSESALSFSIFITRNPHNDAPIDSAKAAHLQFLRNGGNP